MYINMLQEEDIGFDQYRIVISMNLNLSML